LKLTPDEISAILDDPSSASAKNLSSANAEDVAPAVLAAYKRGFRIVFLVSSALAFVFAVFLMPQIEIKHEKKGDSNESSSNNQLIGVEKREENANP
jgi:hypothetical protein